MDSSGKGNDRHGAGLGKIAEGDSAEGTGAGGAHQRRCVATGSQPFPYNTAHMRKSVEHGI